MTDVLNKQPLTFVTPASIKNGDHSAFLNVYNDLHIKVFRFFLKRVLLQDTAADLTQQCFIRLWQFRHTLSPAYPLEKQVFVIAHSLLVNHFDRENHRRKINVHQLPADKKEIQVPAASISFEWSDHVKAAIGNLPPVRKKILLLKTFHDLNNREIALQLKISVKTVEDHITKAFRRMKEVMTLILILAACHFH